MRGDGSCEWGNCPDSAVVEVDTAAGVRKFCMAHFKEYRTVSPYVVGFKGKVEVTARNIVDSMTHGR